MNITHKKRYENLIEEWILVSGQSVVWWIYLYILFTLQRVQSDEFPAVIDVLDVEDPVIANCLIDQVIQVEVYKMVTFNTNECLIC